jgi:hypothetical protein
MQLYFPLSFLIIPDMYWIVDLFFYPLEHVGLKMARGMLQWTGVVAKVL